jgi:hypothetical protein
MQIKDRKKIFRIILLLFLFAIVLDNFLISKIIPWNVSLLKINPILVILGIPVALPVSINPIPDFLIFIFLYTVVTPFHRLNRKNEIFQSLQKKWWPVCAGLAAIPFYTLLAGLMYFSLRDQFPRGFRNSIESFGINVDIDALYQNDGVIHFNGSMIMLIGFLIGIFVFTKKIKATLANSQPVLEQKLIPEKENVRQSASQIKEPTHHVFVQLPLDVPVKSGKKIMKKGNTVKI